ncbi:substrate binding domain-containing protein [Enterobacter hormaechei]
MKITPDGERLAQHACQVVNAVDALFTEKLQVKSDEMKGTIKLTVSSVFGRKFIIPALTRFSKTYPEIIVNCILTDRHSDVINERIDIGIRFGFLPDNRYVAREITKIQFFLCGAPELIRLTGIPKSVNELDTFPLTALIDHNTGRYWPWFFKDMRSFTPSDPRFITDDLEAEFNAVLNGVGFGYMPGFLALPYLKNGQLIRFMEYETISNWGLYLYRPQRGPTSLRIRMLFDYLADILAGIET